MELELKEFTEEQLPEMTEIWNGVVEEGNSFPGDRPLSECEVLRMFREQTSAICAVRGGKVVGVYILHPNNLGRCGHIANASYAVRKDCRGQGIGREMVLHCLDNAKKKGFRGLQFNAVVATNQAAIHLYESLGFQKIGTVKEGYRLKNGNYADIHIFYYYIGGQDSRK